MEVLKELRKEKKATQEEIAKYLGIKKQSYSRYELDIAEPNIENLIKLADYFGVSVDYLIGRKFSNEFGYLDEKDKDAMRLYLSLSEINKIKAVSFISGLLAVQN